jgi:hypothetical protein
MGIFSTLTAMKDGIKAVIYPNTTKAIKAKFHQPLLLDIVSTLWPKAERLKVNVDDSTDEYLEDKVVAGTGVSLAVLDSGGVKTLEISSPSTNTDESVKVSSDDTTASYLENKFTAGDNINITTLNPGANETLELSVTLPALDVFYVDSNNPNPGTGSILDPYQTIDDAVDAVDLQVSRVSVVIRGGSYTVTKNMWKDANFVFEQGCIVTGSLGVGIDALFDQVEEGTSTYAPDVYGQIQYTATGKGFYKTADQASSIRSNVIVSFSILDVTDALPIYLGQGPYPGGGTQTFNIYGSKEGNRGEIILRGTGSNPSFKTKLNGAAQFTIRNIFFNDQSSTNAVGTAIMEIGDQPFGPTDVIDCKFQVNAGLSNPKDYYILLEGVGDGFTIDGIESSNNLQSQALTVIKILGTTPSTSLQLRNISIYNTNPGAGSYFISGGTPDFIMSNIFSTLPFDGAIGDYINETSSGLITVDGVSYVPNSDLRQLTQTAPTVASQYANKQYVDDSVLKPTTTTTTSTANLGFDVDTISQASVTAQAAALQIDAPTGAPVDGQEIRYRIKDDNAGPYLIDWNTAAAFNNTGVAPANTVANKNVYVRAIYDANTSLYDIVETIVLT